MQRESDLLITSMITDRIGRREVLLTINHRYYNFREKKNSHVMKERENLHLNTYKGDVNILRPPRLLPAIRRQTQKRTHARNYNFDYDWLI